MYRINVQLAQISKKCSTVLVHVAAVASGIVKCVA